MAEVPHGLIDDALTVIAQLTGAANVLIQHFPSTEANLRETLERAEAVTDELLDLKTGLSAALAAFNEAEQAA